MNSLPIPTRAEFLIVDRIQTDGQKTDSKSYRLGLIRKAAAAGVLPVGGIQEKPQTLSFFGKEAHQKIAMAERLLSDEGYLYAPLLGAALGGTANVGRSLLGKKRPDRNLLRDALRGAALGGGTGLALKALQSGLDKVVPDLNKPEDPNDKAKLSPLGAVIGGVVGKNVPALEFRDGKIPGSSRTGKVINALEGIKMITHNQGNTRLRLDPTGEELDLGDKISGSQVFSKVKQRAQGDAQLWNQPGRSKTKQMLDFVTGKANLEATKDLMGNTFDRLPTADQKSKVFEALRNMPEAKLRIDLAEAKGPLSDEAKLAILREKEIAPLVPQAEHNARAQSGKAFDNMSPQDRRYVTSQIAGTRAAARNMFNEIRAAKGLGGKTIAGWRSRPVGTVRGVGGALLGLLAPKLLEGAVDNTGDNITESFKDTVR